MATKQFVVTGFVRNENGGPALNATVKAFDKDLRHEQLLGEIVIEETSGRYQVAYTSDQFRRAEKRSADLIVRSWDEDGNLRAESNILFNAPDTATINLTFGPLQTRELSEYERLILALQPILEDVELADLTQNDITFLVGETRQPRQQIEFLQRSARHTRETNIPTEAFYGWARRNLPLELDRLLNEPVERLRRELANAIRERIIPDISKQIDEIIERFAALRIGRGLSVRHDFTLQLLDQESGDPLAGYTVQALDLDATPQPEELGNDLTDGRGLAIATYYAPRPASPDTAPSSRRLQLTIISPANKEIDRIRISASTGQKSPHELRVTIPKELDTSPSIEALALSPSLLASLRRKNISTLADLRRAGGVRRIEGLDRDEPEVERLEAHMRLSTLSADAKDNAVLIAKGFDSPLKIAQAARAEFVRAVSVLGDFKAAQLQAGARAQVKFLNTAVTAFRAEKANGQTPPGFLPDLDKDIEEEATCHCEDCEAAVSPAAYLADLLDYAVTHVKLRTPNPLEFESINLAWLEDQLHQRFGDLPASCEAVGERVRQVRICCEVLRSLIEAEDAGLPIRIRPYLEAAYRSLLTQIGTSYEELRDTIKFGTDEKRTLLADRLGILPERLEALFADFESVLLKQKLNETWLEEHFGLVSTIRDPLVKGDTPLLVTWRLEYLRKVWQDLDFPVDAYTDHTLPFIDPDLIGPDDFRQPQAGEAAFDLWRQRRTFIDNRIARFTDTLMTEGFNTLITEVFDEPAPDLIELRDQLAKGENPEKLKTQIKKLGLTPESLLRLADIQVKAEADAALDDEEIADTINILAQVLKQRQRLTWITEEQDDEIHIDPRIFWTSLREPQEGEWPPVLLQGLPLIDPQTLERKDMVEPTAGETALATWEARDEQLEQDYEAIKEARETDGFDAMLRLALGHPDPGDPLQHDLDQLRADLLNPDEAIVASAEESTTNDLKMTVEDFTLLMTVRAKSANSDPALQPTAEEWNKTYALLTIARKKKHRYPDWLVEETQPDLNPYWKIFKARLPRWRASYEARQAWQQALQLRSQPPLIDPDLLNPNDIVKTEITEPPYSLWKARTTWVKDRLVNLRTMRETADTPLAALDTMLTDEATLEMPVVGLNIFDLLALADQREQGEAITPRLQQLPLENNAFNYLLQVIGKIEDDVEMTESEWHSVDSILVQVAKRQLFAEWRREERDAELHLGPDFFHPPHKTSVPIPEWLATTQARRGWESTLQSRIEQAQTVVNALQEAVSATEEETLVTLRDALIDATDIEGDTQLEKAKWITDHLLIDASASGCQITTRVGQALETVQNLLWSIRTSQLRDSQPDWILDADNFDEEWAWIGSYATWRAAMFVFLYPENIAIPSLRKWQTPPFKRLVEGMRSQRLTPDAACRAANQYADYFKDICQLSLEASCYARTLVHEGDDCHKQAAVEYRRLYHLFARSQVSKKVYWSAYDFTNHSGYAQTFWDVVPGLEGATRIIGAVPYDDFIFVFAIVKVRAGSNALVVTKYDLSANRWDESPQEIEPPEKESSFKTPVVVQRTSDATPPALIVQAGKKTYYRKFTPEDLAGADQPEQDEEDNDDGEAADQWKYLEALVEQNLFGEKTLSSGGTVRNGKVVAAIALEQGICLFVSYFAKVTLAHTFNPQWQEEDYLQFDVGTWQGALIWDQADGETRLYAFVDDSYTPLRITDDLEIDSDPHIPASFLEGGRIAVHCDDESVGAQTFKPIAYSANQDSLYLGTFTRTPDGLVKETKNPFPIAPQITVGQLAFVITAQLSNTERLIRWFLIGNIFINHKNFFAPESVMAYLHEAYFFVPMHLALQLQQAGHYTVALDWFRTVYDHGLPPDQRKIYFGLKAEESLSDSFERTKDWLLDPLNPHLTAATRANTYTRFTLMSIIRCLLDYADNEFTRDTAESVPRARTLYLTALELLQTKELKQKKNACDQLIGSLEIEVGERWKRGLEMVLAELNTLDNAKDVRTVTDAIKALASDERLDDEQKIFRTTSVIAAAKDKASRPQTIARLTDISKERATNAQAAMLADPLIFKAATESANIARMHFLEGMASVTGLSHTELEEGRGDLTWLREPILVATQDIKLHPLPTPSDAASLGFIADVRAIPAVALNTTFGIGQDYLPAPSFGFCIPPNPVLDSLRMRAELNLLKLRQSRNIAGIVRELEPYAAPTDTFSGMPVIGAGGELTLPGLFVLKPTPYRYKILIERAKELVQLAGQIEGAMLAALEKRDAEAYQALRARQELNLARAGIQLQNLRLREARSGVTLAELQRDRAHIQVDTYQEWIETGLIESEQVMLEAYAEARDAQMVLARLATITQIANAAVTAATADYSAAAAWGLFGAFSVVAIGELSAKEVSIRAESAARIASFQASFERSQQEWELQKSLADQDVKIGEQQIQLANDHVEIVEQERDIAVMQVAHATETLDFLTNKFTNVELYDWMSNVLEGVYSFFLQRATSMAKLAENQLAFERQEITPAIIKADYWETPDTTSSLAMTIPSTTDRRGLTGSTRLLQDIYQLDQYAFETDRRKLQLTKVISVAQMSPLELQRFRETGVIVFATPMELFDRDFPGHYLRLIKQVRTSVIALIPPTHGIKATLSTTGASKVVIGGDVFQNVNVSRGPESVALSAPFNATGLFELNPQPEMLLPFEGIGVDTTWELRMPKSSNFLDYNTIADVLITIDYTALNSYDYRQQIIQQLDPSTSADRAYSFRHEFADAWYDLNNPDQTATPMTVRFKTQREDFPPNLDSLRIQHVVLYFVRKSGASFEVTVNHLRFTEQTGPGTVGGSAMSIDAIISTRRGNAGSWTTMIGKTPVGQWELALPNTGEMRNRFKNEEIENILLVLTYSGLSQVQEH